MPPSRCSWYDRHWMNKETDEFVSWFLDSYGPPERNSDHEDDPSEYWRRRAFSLMGWRAAMLHRDGK